jgi:ribonuclease T2
VLVAQRDSSSFDYYVLSLSWAPAFCAQGDSATRNPQECAAGKNIGFIVHGLWPEAVRGRGPEACGTARQVPKAVEKIALPYMLSPGLIQHEWATHGVCTGLAPFDYFSSMIQARAAIQIPVQITSLDHQVTEGPRQIETEFADANPSFPKAAFRTSCPGGVFQEERVCFDKNLKPRACTVSAGECSSPAITVRPPL